MFVMPGNATMPSSVTINEGAIIQNCVGVLGDASAIRTIGDNATVIMNGGAVRNNIASKNGGGISVTDGNTFIMNGGTISGNIAQSGSGGGVLSAGTFIMNGGTIENNKAPNQYGGGFAVTASSDFEFNGGTIKNNEASQGGGVYIERNANNKPYTMENANLLDNTSVNSSGGLYTANPLTILNSVFTGNKTEKTGGGIAAYAPVTVKNSTFKDNIANEGGGLFTRYTVSDSSVVEDSTFEKNSAKFGGAIENWNVTLDVKNSTFNENYATSNGGAIYVFNLGKANLYNSRFEENVAEKLGGAIYTYDFNYNDPVDVTKYQNIVLDDENYFDNNVAIAGLFQPLLMLMN